MINRLEGLLVPPGRTPVRLGPLHFLKRGLRQGLWPLLQRYHVFPRVLRMPPLAIKKDTDFTVHIRVSCRDVVMAHWAIRTLTLFSNSQFDIMLHEDGTCSARQLELLSDKFRGIKIVTNRDAAQNIATILRNDEGLLNWFMRRPRNLKWPDCYLLGKSDVAIVCDSDILFFDEPKALFSPDRVSRWMADSGFVLDLPMESGRILFGGQDLLPLNAGLGRVPRNAFSLDLLRAFLRAIPEPKRDQTFHAVVSSAAANQELLPPSYSCATEPGLRGCVVKHYTSPFRFWYFEEGIPRAAALLGMPLPPWLRERP